MEKNKRISHKHLTFEKKEKLAEMMGKFSGKVSLSLLDEINRYKNINDELDNTYIDFIDEECNICGKHLTRTEDILVDSETDVYLCKECVEEYDVQAVRCKELN